MVTWPECTKEDCSGHIEQWSNGKYLCDECKMEYEIKQTEDTSKVCENCDWWEKDGYASGERRSCRGLSRGGQELFSNDGCSNDFIYCTAPEFFCGLFKGK